ncbi:MAG: CRISPR-associated endonuclease Cas1 [Leptolyngbyaceae cyanobacterium bins.302]|nr:CRISPR-associated endonuclease Cas1 [Leptolyngbyaceae cyanobacterium bins.302]
MTTIYIAQPHIELKIQSRQLQVFQQQKFCFAVPLNRVNQMVILGQHPWSRRAANLALSLHIPVVYFEPDGNCIEYLNPATVEAAKYLKVQMARSQEDAFVFSTAESLVRAHLHNSQVLLCQLSDEPRPATVVQVLNLLHRLQNGFPEASSLAALQTYAATATSFYRAALSRLLPEHFCQQNLGINPIGRLTNLGNALLSQRIQITLQNLGLDLDIGNLHPDAITRPPLICDFLTEFGVQIVDALVMHLLTNSLIIPDDFIWFEQGLFLRPTALEMFIEHWDSQLSAKVDHLYTGEVTYQQCLEIQAQEYIACLLDEQSFYRPMLLKG